MGSQLWIWKDAGNETQTRDYYWDILARAVSNTKWKESLQKNEKRKKERTTLKLSAQFQGVDLSSQVSENSILSEEIG